MPRKGLGLLGIVGACVEMGDHGCGDGEGVREGLFGNEVSVGIGLFGEFAVGVDDGVDGLVDVGLTGPAGEGDDVALGGVDGVDLVDEEADIEAVFFKCLDECEVLGGEGLWIGEVVCL